MILGVDWYMVLLGGTCQVGIMTFAKRRISLWLRAQFVVEICEVKLMSKQRRIHQTVTGKEYAYKTARRLAYQFGYKHKPRWRQTCGVANRITRQTDYALFGPAFFSAERR